VNSRTTGKFWKVYNKLPSKTRNQAKSAFVLFQKDPYHPSLHFKRVHSVLPIYSARITKDYRAVGIQKKADIIWFWIGSHSDYGKLLKQL